MRNVDSTAMRKMNKATVLGLIRSHRTTSRIDIAQMTGLNKATVSYIVDELIEEKWVHEIGFGSSSGGRKPVLLRFNANGAYAIGMDVQLHSLKTVICNARGEAVYKRDSDIPPTAQSAHERLLDVIGEQAHAAMIATPASPHGLVGVGLGLPGLVNANEGTVSRFPGVDLANWDVRSAVGKRVSMPVFCDNNANCGAWSELVHDPSQDANLVYINVGTSIGTGVIIGGRLYRGREGRAGEFGHTTVMPMGQRCSCGNYGCWEEYASERSLLRYIIEAGGDMLAFEQEHDFVQHILDGAHEDNRAYIRAFNTLGQHLGVGIANIANALTPDRISVGGTLSRAATFILPEIERIMKYRALSANRSIPVTIANANSVAVGAASLVLNAMLFDRSEHAAHPGTAHAGSLP